MSLCLGAQSWRIPRSVCALQRKVQTGERASGTGKLLWRMHPKPEGAVVVPEANCVDLCAVVFKRSIYRAVYIDYPRIRLAKVRIFVSGPRRVTCEARRREIVLIFGCGNGLVRDGPGASKVDGGLRAGGPQGLQAKPGGDTRPRAKHWPHRNMS